MINPRRTSRRLALSIVMVFVLVGVFLVRLVDFQVVRADELSEQADQRRTATVTTAGVRGGIVDENGVVLAGSVERFDITASPRNVGKLTEITRDGERVKVPTEEAIAALAAVTGQQPSELQAILTADPESDFAYLIKGVKLEVFRDVRALGIAWVYSELNPSRTYPSGAIAGNLVGFMGTDGPLAGMEYRNNDCLAPTSGVTSYEVSADGVRLPGSVVVRKEPKDGGTLHLTIDSDLQWFAQQALAEQGSAIGAEWGTAFVVEVKTGKIRAAADWPSIDPNDLDSAAPEDAGARSFSSPYEPGSVIKAATIASLLDAGRITAGTQVLVPGRYTEGLPAGSYIGDSWWHGDLRYTAAGILMNSSNIGIAELSTRMSTEQRTAYLKKFGFGTPTEVDFLGEASGYLADPATIDVITDLTQQFGQGMTATSAQVASLYQTLGNGGVRLPLTLIDGCEQSDGTLTQTPPTAGTRVVSESAATTTVNILETVASEGYLKNVISIPGYRVAAKTGTAEVAENGHYGSDRIVSVAGLVPADDPQYVVVATFAKPVTMKSSAAAAPTFNAIMEQVIKTYRVTPSTEPAPDIPLTW